MLSLPTPASARQGARAAPLRRALPGDALAARCEALEALGDAVALLDAERGELSWVSSAWARLQPALVVGLAREPLGAALPGLLAAIDQLPWPVIAPGRGRVPQWGPSPAAPGAEGSAEDGAAPAAAASGARSLRIEGPGWLAEVAPLVVLGRRLVVLRLADRREQGRALQRQLDDREQLLFTSRVISVGEMASTLAHELNQPIGAAANLLRGLRMRLAREGASRLDEAETTALDRSIDQVMFAARVIARIREFTHARQPRPVPLDLAALVHKSAALLDWDLERTGTTLVLHGPDRPVPVRGDEVMLQQVLVNLMRNALDAMRGDPPEAPRLEVSVRPGPQEVEVQVRDNGCGLSDEAEQRLFVPFASTKPSGMGLGLSICRSFIELHQGRLWFSRNEGRGATFHISLPIEAVR